jgi:hypothetical protein
MNDLDLRQAGDIESYEGRGVWVPHGLQASWIIAGAEVLQRDFEVAPYTARAMVRALLLALPPLEEKQ